MVFNKSTSGSASAIGALTLLYDGADSLLNTLNASLFSRQLYDFIESVRWNEPFILSLIALQVVLLVFILLTRRYDSVQFGVLVALTAISLNAERLNTLGKRYWRVFATQDYFDRPGLFMLVFVTGPFVMLANIIVVSH